ncbi:amino acid transporter [Sparassis latifolia]
MTSTAFLIFNRIIGTSIFATPSVILRASGSVGLLLVMWVLGAILAMCGTAVFIELGTGLPKNGGEKNYLEFIYRRPRFLVTCVYAMYAVFIGWETTSSVIFGEYGLHALNPSVSPAPAATRLAGVLCISLALVLHGTHPSWGIHVSNVLGVFKLLVLVVIIASGLAVLARVPGFELSDPPRNFEWDHMWEGTLTGGVSAFVTGLFTVVWSFTGYSNANYALSEIRDPVRTMKIAAPCAIIVTSVAYFLVNIAYFAVVDKKEVLGSGRIVAALFFGKIWGVRAESALSAIVSMSALANVLAVLFTHGRVIQELGREGILPFSSFFASNKPFDAPLAGLFAQWFITCLLVVTVPPGDAYLFMLNMIAYPFALINAFVSAGLLFLHSPWKFSVHERYHWDPPFRTPTPVVLLFFLSNVFLVCAPLVPPAPGFTVYERLPYWLHVLVSSSISLVGVVYWYVCFVWLPRRGGYALVREWIRGEDGIPRRVVKRVKTFVAQEAES